MESKFKPERLKEAQAIRGLSNPELAEKLGVVTDVVSRWRRGISAPKEKNMTPLAEALEAPSAFFYSEKKLDIEKRLLKRDKVTRGKKDDEAQRYIIEHFTEGVEGALNLFDFKNPDFPEFNLPHPNELKRCDIMGAASLLRDHWETGGMPIRTLSNLLFSKRVFVQRVDMSWGGVSFIESGVPFIFIQNGNNRSRDKMTIAHELGHIVLHHLNVNFDIDEATKKDRERYEKQAYFFGTCFLAPKEVYIKDVFSVSYECLASLKPKWQISIGAQVMYLHSLGLIDDKKKATLFKAMSWKQRSKAKEPYENDIVYEEADFLQEAIKTLKETGRIRLLDEIISIKPDVVTRKFRDEESVIIQAKFG